MRAVRVKIHGRVQGVGYREWTRREARSLRLNGWVRNEPDGTVAALVVGEDETVANLIGRFRSGPSLASVTSVEVEDVAIPTEMDDFRIER